MQRFLILLIAFVGLCAQPAYSQLAHEEEHAEDPGLPLKILHAEPLYIDLIRDLGARKGEREWNVGGALVDREKYDSYELLVEYEWAVRDRWGLEFEIPVTLYSWNKRNGGQAQEGIKPSNRIESLKMATQYTFLVSEKAQASLAVGSIVEWELADLDGMTLRRAFDGVLLNPFFIAAKRLGENWHSLLYTGPRLLRHFHHPGWDFAYEINTNFHYMIPGTRNFVGVEVNKIISSDIVSVVVRPQMRLEISESLMLGIVPGIPLNIKDERLSAFMRLIYEPSHRPKRK
jgi:hypothetical protein